MLANYNCYIYYLYIPQETNQVHNVLFLANCSGSPLPEDVVIINSTSSQLTYACICSTSIMIVKTAVCAGNGTWLPQVSCGEDDCITELGNHYLTMHL